MHIGQVLSYNLYSFLIFNLALKEFFRSVWNFMLLMIIFMRFFTLDLCEGTNLMQTKVCWYFFQLSKKPLPLAILKSYKSACSIETTNVRHRDLSVYLPFYNNSKKLVRIIGADTSCMGPDPTNFRESNMDLNFCIEVLIHYLLLGPYHLFNPGGVPAPWWE